MILIVGLGNPGKKYEKTRHNIGFRIIDSLDFARNKDVLLFKPQTYMNNSGKSVREKINYYKIPAENLVVVHDDSDLPIGIIRIDKNASSAGHKGVQSIIDELGTKNFARIRIGIGKDKKIKAGKIVLQKFTNQEEKIIEKIIEKTGEIIEKSLKERIKKTTIKIT